MEWFWYFVIYSFLGCLLEMLAARVRHWRRDRKCLLVLPLCPVYGLGACAVLLIAPLAGGSPAALYFLGAAVCTAVEYGMAFWYERAVGVPFWDYSGVAGNLHGRVCPPFSLIWGGLILALYYLLHPSVAALVASIPPVVTLLSVPLLLVDVAVSGVLLRRTHSRDCLRWYDGVLKKARYRRA